MSASEPILQQSDQQELKKPQSYSVFILSDDFTPIDFVVVVLVNIFSHDFLSAQQVMWEMHKNGLALAGVFSKQLAETKIAQTHMAAQKLGHPLRCELVPAL